MCIESCCFEGKAAFVWSSPLTFSQCWVIEWVELYITCSICLNGMHSHNFSFSPHTTTISTVEMFDEFFPYRLMHTVNDLQHFVTFLCKWPFWNQIHVSCNYLYAYVITVSLLWKMYLNLIKVTLLRGCLQCPVPELCRIPLNCIREV